MKAKKIKRLKKSRSSILRRAKQLKATGEHWIKIAEMMKKEGYVSERTGKPYSANGLRDFCYRSGRAKKTIPKKSIHTVRSASDEGAIQIWHAKSNDQIFQRVKEIVATDEIGDKEKVSIVKLLLSFI